jgi:mono/diheme cytochrome c family protein
MAATDKPFRNQYKLDVVFGASCVALLLATGWMFYDDHYRPYKKVQRHFRDVEAARYEQGLIDKLPPTEVLGNVHDAYDKVRGARKELREEEAKIQSKETDLLLKKARDEARSLDVKARVDSVASLVNLAVEERDASDEAHRAALDKRVGDLRKQVDGLRDEYNKAEKDVETDNRALDELRAPVKAKDRELARALAPDLRKEGFPLPKRQDDIGGLSDIEDALRKTTGDADRLAKVTAQKTWKAGDTFRGLPILDAFASPAKPQQISLNDLTIEYGSFKEVPRYDRCTTCHLAIERGNFDKESLRRLASADSDAQDKYDEAFKFYQQRKADGENVGFDPDDLPSHNRWPVGIVALVLLLLSLGGGIALGVVSGSPGRGAGVFCLGLLVTGLASWGLAHFSPRDPDKVLEVKLSEPQVTQYCAHPRLDLFVDSNSAHPAEKFGCTACHAGQGSATEFTLASHTPNDAVKKEEWQKEHGWEFNHDWEFPMLPARFVESSCLKCHHQVTDLIRYGSKEEAPKLLLGYNLVRENGCFGCHEISGLKGSKEVGPDLRLEPSPALENLEPAERARMLSDAANPPGTMRKVGPSLRRISEKTNEEWARKWINSPRGFRPDTRMPHFYNLSNNTPDRKDPAGRPMLADDQKDFPAAEINSIAHFLFAESRAYLAGSDRFRHYNETREKELAELEKNNQLSEAQAKELAEIRQRLTNWTKPVPLDDQHILDGDGKPVPAGQIPEASQDAKNLAEGQRLFTERGCLGCHSHSGTESGATPVHGEATFGPNLSRIAEKMVVMKGGRKDAAAGRRWVIQWVLNPNVHFPRTRMPITHLKPEEAARVADWLLSQQVEDKEFQEWNKNDVKTTDEAVRDLARVYLKKAPGVNPLEVDDILRRGFTPEQTRPPQMARDADEHVLEGDVTTDKLKYYVGKKAVSRLGCFGCHDIPGFEYAKPIGTPLNDWGKKDPARIAFEDITAYVKDQYEVVPTRDDPENKAEPSDKWAEAAVAAARDAKEGQVGKRPYEKFFADALTSHHREGFLHQKLMEPRSYDYHRDVRWDDRLRMPQFKFAHPKRKAGEKADGFAARAEKEEAEAREAVMTFILGLVAEPIHPRYLNNPGPDRSAEVKGRQVLDKFNCAGCHVIQPGVYDVKLDDEKNGFRRQLKLALSGDVADDMEKDVIYPADHAPSPHDAWSGTQPLGADHVMVRGIRLSDTKDSLLVRLSDAVRAESLPDAKGRRTVLDVPAPATVRIPQSALVSRADPWGGRFADLMVDYVRNKTSPKGQKIYDDERNARGALPPPLVREGERVQPEWLFGFLRNPTPIRPATVGGLRMPKFNMSEDEARAIVNYFAAGDKARNPGIGLTYPYVAVPERRDTYWQDRNREYVDRLASDKNLAERAKTYREQVQKQLVGAKDEKDKDELKKVVERIDKAGTDEGKLKDALAQSDVYWTDAYRLLTMGGKDAICLKCHNVGGLKAGQGPEGQGPPLDLAHNRLRPDWTERWLGNPKRLLTYTPVMSQNFDRGNDKELRNFFDAPSRDKVQALRDVLMNYPKVADLPVNRSYQPPATSGGK